MRKRFCGKCAYYSTEHGLCFHPDSFTQGVRFNRVTQMYEDTFKSPGDPLVLNRDNKCRLYDGNGPRKKGLLFRFWRAK